MKKCPLTQFNFSDIYKICSRFQEKKNTVSIKEMLKYFSLERQKQAHYSLSMSKKIFTAFCYRKKKQQLEYEDMADV